MPPSGYASTNPGSPLIVATDSRRAFGRAHRHGFLQVRDRLLRVQPFTCIPKSTTIIGVIELMSADVVEVRIVETDLAARSLRHTSPSPRPDR